MLRIHEDSGAVLGLWTDGNPTKDQLSGIVNELKARIGRFGRVRLLIRMPTKDAWNASALLDILGLSRAVGRGIEKLAVVGRNCADCTQDLLALFYQQTAFFHADRLEQAWEWITKTDDDAEEVGEPLILE